MRAFFSTYLRQHSPALLGPFGLSRCNFCINSFAEGSNASGLLVMLCSMGQQMQGNLIAFRGRFAAARWTSSVVR